jgi:5-methylcytosine-specific restriction endonuclease McrA
MIYKRCPRCGKRVETGKKCGCLVFNKREYTKPEGTRRLYHTARWRKLQQMILAKYSGIDPYALSKKRVEYANTVHHIVPAAEDESQFWNPDNLIPLSRGSHDEVHTRYRVGEGEKRKCQDELRACLRAMAAGLDTPGGWQKV